MTWVKTQPELPNKMAGDDLSESAALAHYCAIAYLSGTERFDCLIPRRLLGVVLPLTEDREAAVAELVKRGYWAEHGERDLEVVEHGNYIRQSLVSVGKKRNTDAKAARRYRDKGSTDEPSVTDSATDSADESLTESAPGLPTEQTTEPSRSEASENQRADCRHCGEPSAFLDGGYCRRGNCVQERRETTRGMR